MKVDVYTVVRNEEYMIKYFLRHYSTFAERIFVFDDHCDDKTVEIVEHHPYAAIIPYPFNNGFNEEDFAQCYYDAYQKYSRGKADWVICVDCDELVYDKNILRYLESAKSRGIQAIQNTSYFMVSTELPETDKQIYDVCKEGVRSPRYDKTTVYSPEIDFKYGPGRHTYTAPGIKVERGLLMLHYRYLSYSYFVDRMTKNFSRMPNKEDFKYRMDRGFKWYKWALGKKTKIL